MSIATINIHISAIFFTNCPPVGNFSPQLPLDQLQISPNPLLLCYKPISLLLLAKLFHVFVFLYFFVAIIVFSTYKYSNKIVSQANSCWL